MHKVLESTSDSTEAKPQPAEKPTEFIGLVNVKSLDADALALPEDLTLPAAAAATTLTVEVAYSFLPSGWGQGYATESVDALYESCKRARSFWKPFSKVYVRAVVHEGIPASLRVVEKTGMTELGVYHWSGEALFFAGERQERANLHIFGMHLLE